jgi:hypothetical protein
MMEYWNGGMLFLDILTSRYWENRHPACVLAEQARCLFSQCLMPVTTDSVFHYSTIPIFQCIPKNPVNPVAKSLSWQPLL